jgi:hypothetical protein
MACERFKFKPVTLKGFSRLLRPTNMLSKLSCHHKRTITIRNRVKSVGQKPKAYQHVE